jgi:hypothetical protein
MGLSGVALAGDSPAPVFVGPMNPEMAALGDVSISVNGQVRRVTPGQTLEVVLGDRVTVMAARLRREDVPIEEVNFVGFPGRYGAKADDRGLTARTDRDLKKSFQVKDAPEGTYAVVAKSWGLEHGRVFVHVARPELRGVVIAVNGQERAVDLATGLEIGPRDKIRVTRVKTTIPDNRDVRVEMTDPAAEGGRQTRLSLLYRGREFGSVSLRVRKE